MANNPFEPPYPDPPEETNKQPGKTWTTIGMVFFWLIVLLACCSCAPTPKPEPVFVTQEHTTVPTPDESLRHCKTRPAKPDTSVDPSAKVAELIDGLFAWGEDCEAKLGGTWQSIDQAKAQAEKDNANGQ